MGRCVLRVPCFALTSALAAGRRRVFLSGVDLAQEACDEARFCKSTRGPLDQVRNLTGDAL